MEKLEKVIERLMKQTSKQWTKRSDKKLPNGAGWGNCGSEVVCFSARINSKHYSLEKRTKLIEISYDVWDGWDCQYRTDYDFKPDPKSIMYKLTVSRTISSGDTSASEEVEYRNNNLLRGLFDYIDGILD